MRRLYTILVMALCVLWLGGCIHDDTPHKREKVRVGDALPDFSVTMNDGSVVTGESLRERVAVVLFFSTSCPDCQQALPLLQRIYDEFADSLAIVLISRQQPEDEISAYWADQGFTMPYSAQLTREIYELFAQERVPRIYLSPTGGQIQAIFTDSPVPTYEILLEQVNKIL